MDYATVSCWGGGLLHMYNGLVSGGISQKCYSGEKEGVLSPLNTEILALMRCTKGRIGLLAQHWSN